MGFNSVVMLMNDLLSEMADNKELGKEIYESFRFLGSGRDGLGFPGGKFISTAHADYYQIVVVNRNDGRLLENCNDLPPIALEQLADALTTHGWRVKPPARVRGRKVSNDR